MSFKPDPQKMLGEITEAARIREDSLRGVNGIIKEYTGRWYRGAKDWAQYTQAAEDREVNPEPYAYSYISNMLASLIFQNPTVIVQARRVIGHKMVADALTSGLKGWLNDVAYHKEAEKVVLDFFFFQGILMHFIEDDTRWSAGAVRPNVKRIDFRKFLIDSTATCIEDAEWMGHEYYVDMDDLMSDPAVLPEMLAKLKPSSTEDDSNKEPFKKGDPSMLKRERIMLYNIWLRRSNQICVYTQNGEPLYPDRDYYGPDSGPYQVFQAYPVPGQVMPLSPLVAVQDQVIDLQAHGRATARSAAARKTVVVVDGNQPNLGEDIKNAEDREVVAVSGFSSSQAQQLEFGGVTPAQYQYLNFLRDRLDRHGGLTDTARGDVQSNTTATESQIASEALNNRTEYLKGRIRNCVAESLTKIGWFMFHTTGIIIPVSMRDPATGQESEGVFFGGPTPQQDSGTWQDYSIKIEPYSMARISEAVVQRRAMDVANLVMQVAPLMPQMPWVRWMEVVRMVGESMNQENIESLFIPEVLGMMGRPDLALASTWTGQGAPPPRYFSQPGMGFKPPTGGVPSMAPQNMGDQYQPALYGRRQDFGQQFGGTQGPPGSAAAGAMA